MILTEGDREINLPESRFLHVAPHALNVQKGRDQLIQSLRDIAKHREELRLRIDLAEVWELVWAEPEAYDCAFLAGLVFGEEVTPDHTAAMYRACWDDTIHFCAQSGYLRPQPSGDSRTAPASKDSQSRARTRAHGRRGVRQDYLGRICPNARRIGGAGDLDRAPQGICPARHRGAALPLGA